MKKELSTNNKKYTVLQIMLLLLFAIIIWAIITVYLIREGHNTTIADYNLVLFGMFPSLLFYFTLIGFIRKVETTEQSLRRTKKELELIIDSVPAMIWYKDKNNNYLRVNRKVAEGTGFPAEELAGKSAAELYPGLGEDFFKRDLEVLRTGKPATGILTRLPVVTGGYIWIQVDKIPYYDDNGNISGILAFAVDITEKRKKEEELNQKIMEQEALLNTIPAYIYYKDRDFKYIVTNKSYAEVYKKTPDEMIGLNDYDLTKHKISKRHKDIDEQIFETGLPKTGLIEKNEIVKDNEVRWVSVNKFPYRDINGDIKGIVGITFDITDQIKIENELKDIIEENKRLLDEVVEYDKIKTAIFSNISHEFKTPLNVILSTLQLISTFRNQCNLNDCDKKIEKYTGIMKQNCFRLLRLINNLIDVTRIESGFISMNVHNYNIINIIEDTTLSISAFAQNHNIDLEFDTNIEEKVMSCDADKIERIILNLLSNAVKFTKPGGKISVKVKDKQEKIRFSVKDTGIGIPHDKLDAIFDRFSQLNQSLTRDHEGSGIGLYLVKSLVEMHEGKILVESELGKGTEFIVELPVKILPDNEIDYKNIPYKELASTAGIEFSDIY